MTESLPPHGFSRGHTNLKVIHSGGCPRNPKKKLPAKRVACLFASRSSSRPGSWFVITGQLGTPHLVQIASAFLVAKPTDATEFQREAVFAADASEPEAQSVGTHRHAI